MCVCFQKGKKEKKLFLSGNVRLLNAFSYAFQGSLKVPTCLSLRFYLTVLHYICVYLYEGSLKLVLQKPELHTHETPSNFERLLLVAIACIMETMLLYEQHLHNDPGRNSLSA